MRCLSTLVRLCLTLVDEIKNIKEFIRTQKINRVHKNKELKNNRMQEINDNVHLLEAQTETALKSIFKNYSYYRNEIEKFLLDECESREDTLDKIYAMKNGVVKKLENRSKDIYVLRKCINQIDTLFDSFKETRVSLINYPARLSTKTIIQSS